MEEFEKNINNQFEPSDITEPVVQNVPTEQDNITVDNEIPAEEQKEETPPYETVGVTLNNQDCEEPSQQDPQREKYEESKYGSYASFEKVPYVAPSPVVEYKPMSKGLKVFALVMALVILLTGACATGYFFGKNSDGLFANEGIKVDLSAKPKNTTEMTASEVYEKVNKSVVGIEVYNESGSLGQASGVVYSKDGYIVTNDHIYSEIPAAKFKIHDYNGKEYDAQYVAGDSISDLALLKVKNGSGFTVPDFGDSDDLVFGENVVAVGRPSDARSASSITKGIISHTNRRMSTTSSYTARLIQTDSAINPGSSGGALVNMYGQIVGITSSKLAGEEYDSMGFSIPTTTMKRVVTQLSKNGKVEDRAKLGITYTEITSLTAEIGDYDECGLLVASVSEDSDLYGKVKKGDIITYVNGKKITDSNVVLDIIDESKAGNTITVTVLNSKGKSKDYKAELKANVGESSYSLSEKNNDDDSSVQQLPNNNNPFGGSDGSDGGTFDFPKGE